MSRQLGWTRKRSDSCGRSFRIFQRSESSRPLCSLPTQWRKQKLCVPRWALWLTENLSVSGQARTSRTNTGMHSRLRSKRRCRQIRRLPQRKLSGTCKCTNLFRLKVSVKCFQSWTRWSCLTNLVRQDVARSFKSCCRSRENSRWMNLFAGVSSRKLPKS